MSWITISDGRRVQHLLADQPALVPVGTLVIETSTAAERTAPHHLVFLDRDKGWPLRFRVTLTAHGEIEVEHQQGQSRFFAVIEEPRLRAEDTLRIAFAWDAPRRIAHLTAEAPMTGAFVTARFSAPMPFPHEDMLDLLNSVDITPAVSALAVSDRIEPVGPSPSFLEGTLVDTAAGPKRIEALTPGDLLPTASGRFVPVQRVVSRTVPAVGAFRPVTLRAPFLGLLADLTVAPHHRVMLHGTDTEYLFGTETVLLEARHLGPMLGARSASNDAVVTYYQVLLRGHECIGTGGAWSESLFLGDLARRPARHAVSILADVSQAHLPIHSGIAGPLLKPYEAMVLVSNLCA